jgi:ribosomal-protein-alanine N-acetyltransferase
MLEVRESNVAARALYENNGFVIDGVRPQYYKMQQGREDALLMSRRL